MNSSHAGAMTRVLYSTYGEREGELISPLQDSPGSDKVKQGANCNSSVIFIGSKSAKKKVVQYGNISYSFLSNYGNMEMSLVLCSTSN